jgi:hypothetical protein
MLRTSLLAIALAFAIAPGGCHHDPKPMAPADGEGPPLPPASGTPVGYLLDNAGKLKLSDEQITKLKRIDDSLSAQNDGIETQIREIEKPEDDEEKPEKGAPPKRKNNAPGAFAIHTTAGSDKLHAAKEANNKDALTRAFAILDAEQQASARKLLDARGITAPGGGAAGPGNQPPPPKTDTEGGVPLEP